jgi:hypothetical protein
MSPSISNLRPETFSARVLATAEAQNKIQRERSGLFPLPPLLKTDILYRSYRSMGDHTETTEIDFDPAQVTYDEVETSARTVSNCFFSRRIFLVSIDL